jgi:hypothetical protein
MSKKLNHKHPIDCMTSPACNARGNYDTRLESVKGIAQRYKIRFFHIPADRCL